MQLTRPGVLPAWSEDAVQLLAPALGVMARPVILNNLKRVAADPAHPTPEEIHLFFERVARGISTFASLARGEALIAQLRHLILSQNRRDSL